MSLCPCGCGLPRDCDADWLHATTEERIRVSAAELEAGNAFRFAEARRREIADDISWELVNERYSDDDVSVHDEEEAAE